MPTVVITGASRGIGLGLAQNYSKLGWNVIATSRKAVGDDHELKKLLNTHVFVMDVASSVSITTCAENVKKFLADSNIDGINVLVNNAGIAVSDHGEKAGVSTADISSLSKETLLDFPSSTDADNMLGIFKTNVIGVLLVTQAFLPLLKQQTSVATEEKQSSKPPLVVNMSSIGGSIGSLKINEFGGLTSYRASKAALNMLTRTFAAEKKEIVFIVYHPGMVASDMGIAGDSMVFEGKIPPMTVQQCVEAFLQVISGHHKLESSGKFLQHSGEELCW